MEGEYIIDGYNFKGKQSFKKAKVGLYDLMKRGIKGEVEGVEHRVLDRRTKGAEEEIEIEIVDNGSRGVAEKVIKPLMNGFLSSSVKAKLNDPKKQENPLVCPYCDKTLNTSSGLKGHITKMHRDLHRSMNKGKAHQIKDDKLNDLECILLSDDTDEDGDTALNEKTGGKGKEYSDNCDVCDFQVKTNRKYELIQIVLKHKETCSFRKQRQRSKTCTDCNFEGKDELNMKRHKRDKHNILTESTSPPPKKKKITKISTNDEMDVDEKECEETTITEDIGQNINEPKKTKINLPGAAEVCIEDVMDISVTDDNKIGDISF